MQQLIQFLKFLVSRQVLGFLVVAALALAIWFVGPLLVFAGARPLASPMLRVALILMLLLTLGLWLAAWPVRLAAIPALCLLVWEVGPLLALGNVAPLKAVGPRLGLIGLILGLCLLYGIYRLWLAMRTDTEFLKKVLNFGSGASTAKQGTEGLKAVNESVYQALRQLKGLQLRGGFLRRVFEARRFVYELPWYMIVGSPGAGKTTALLNAGLQFPASRQTGHITRAAALNGNSGTMNCSWWIANEAVFIDTAGRYTTQQSDRQRDAAEWGGFLALLRKHRPRAPINGVIVVLSVKELRRLSPDERVDHAAQLRDRLAELRSELGIRFPVYVMVTMADQLGGFEEYFQSLTSEGRAQVWGFTLPFAASRPGRRTADAEDGRSAMRQQLEAEFELIHRRVADGLRGRLVEEFDVQRRRRLFALPQELAQLREPLFEVLDGIFLDSRFDDTQAGAMLRGVYFTSAAQVQSMPLPKGGILKRLLARIATIKAAENERQKQEQGTVDQKKTSEQDAVPVPVPPEGTGAFVHRGFFLQDLFARIVIPEAHLVRPNLRWEVRFRLLQTLGHALSVVVLLWIAAALALSFRNNGNYLQTIEQKAKALSATLAQAGRPVPPAAMPQVLDDAYDLPDYPGLDLANPPSTYQYGLYSAPPVVDASGKLYARLEDELLLPLVLGRMEDELSRSLREQDARAAYAALRAYKLLHDPQRYMRGGAAEVRAWVLKDWETRESAAVFGGRAAMVGHVERLFSGARLVQSPSLPKEVLVREVQAFLGSSTSSQRVYERAKSAMALEAPAEFTLVRAVGPQVGTVFARAEGEPLESGIPGLFTYDGYHGVFDKRLTEFVARAQQDDAWVMGRSTANGKAEALGVDGRPPRDAALLEDVRRQYLSEYAARWTTFLESVRVVGAEGGGGSLGFDLSVLRQLAAPDSPLARLARAAAHETSLSRPLGGGSQDNKGLLDKATEQIDRQTRELTRNLGIRPEERLERQLVDDRFAALREIVTGQPDLTAVATGPGTGRASLDSILGVINELYTVLVVADTAMTAGSLPPGGTDVGARMKLEAGKLPAPFREVLTALATNAADKVLDGTTAILRKQAQQQFDRLMGLFALNVTEPCRRGIQGRYPFVDAGEDASAEDVSLMFSAGGAVDSYFTKYLAPFVDTSVRPWRYKNPAAGNALVGVENAAAGVAPAPAVSGPTLLGELLKLLAQGGPDLAFFQRAQQVRDLLFRDADGRRLSWKMDLRVTELEPSITELIIDIDGQAQRYVHGPVEPLAVKWPGPRGGVSAQITAQPRISAAGSTILAQGPWAIVRLLRKGRIVSTATPGHTAVEYNLDGRRAVLDVSSGSQPNPFNSDLLSGFRCPGVAG